MSTVQIASVDRPEPDPHYDNMICEWYSLDYNSVKHWADTPWDAKESALDANRVITEHNQKNPGGYDVGS